jgi:hypothetical protein
MRSYTIRFYRSQYWADRFANAGVDKPAGWVCSPYRYTRHDAAWLVLHMNSFEPEHPCELVTAI